MAAHRPAALRDPQFVVSGKMFYVLDAVTDLMYYLHDYVNQCCVTFLKISATVLACGALL